MQLAELKRDLVELQAKREAKDGESSNSSLKVLSREPPRVGRGNERSSAVSQSFAEATSGAESQPIRGAWPS